MYGAATLSAAALLLGAIGAQAAGPPTTFKCSAAQIKCVSGKATAFLGCHNKAEGKNVAVDPECITKAEQKFTLPAKGCMDKAEKDLVKSPCPNSGSGFIALLENKSDAFVLDVVQELDPGYPAPVLSKCSAGKKKCVANKVKAVLGCYNKAAGKNLPVDPACLQKATDKFDGGADPTKGCFAKLYAKVPNDCLTPIDVAAMEAKVDAFALDIFNLTTPPPPPTILDFANGLPGGTCGSARDGSNTVIKTLTLRWSQHRGRRLDRGRGTDARRLAEPLRAELHGNELRDYRVAHHASREQRAPRLQQHGLQLRHAAADPERVPAQPDHLRAEHLRR